MLSEEQLYAVVARELSKNKRKFLLEKYCFKEQLDFIKDESKFKTAVCGRRSGKTTSCAADLISTAINRKGVVCVYITLSRLNAKRILWSELVRINTLYNLKGKLNETELVITFPNKSVIYLAGAKDKSTIVNFRGLPIALCYLDESQSFRSYIEELIEDVITKALYDFDGTLCLIGTPGPVPSGYFYDCAHSKSWSHHSWTMYQNPWLQKKSGKTPDQLLQRDLTRKGISIDDPTIQREVFAKWVTDPNALVFRYNSTINDYSELPTNPGNWEYVFGVDLGFDDSDAIAVLGWNEFSKNLYLVDELVTKKQGITSLVEQLSGLMAKYPPLKIVMDTGGLGKKIAEEISARHGIPIAAAEKSRKFEYIELLNDAMRTRKFHAKKDTEFAQDCMIVEWDRDVSNEKIKISDSYHSDITDAVLYAFRECLHWITEPDKPIVKHGTEEWMQREVNIMEEYAQNELQRQKEDDFTMQIDSNDW